MLQARAVAVGLRYRLRLRLHPADTLSGPAPPVRPGSGRYGAGALSAAVQRVERIVPGQTCLPSALTMRDLMHRDGRRAEVVLGVATHGPQGFRAHAWVEDDEGQVVHGARSEPYERLR